MEQYLTAVSTVGFPIVAYLLVVFKQNKALDSLTQAVNNNTTAIQILMEARKGQNNG